MNKKEQFNLRSSFCVLLTIFVVMFSCENKPAPVPNPNTDNQTDNINIDLDQYTSAKHLINPDQLLKWQVDKSVDLVLIDVRKKEEYDQGHLKNAGHVWRPDIRSENYPYKGMMLEKEALQALMQRLGANNISKIVIYDGKGNPDAARLWWMLAIYGYHDVYLLNGGIMNIDSQYITKDPTIVSKGNFAFRSDGKTEMKDNKETVLAALQDKNTILLDCRTEDEFSGKTMKKGAFRAGHIPQAFNIDYSEAIAYERSCTFRDRSDLEERFKALPKDKKIIIYCQSGVRSALLAFVFTELLGYPSVSNYDGSWIEWSYYKELPIETEDKKPALM